MQTMRMTPSSGDGRDPATPALLRVKIDPLANAYPKMAFDEPLTARCTHTPERSLETYPHERNGCPAPDQPDVEDPQAPRLDPRPPVSRYLGGIVATHGDAVHLR